MKTVPFFLRGSFRRAMQFALEEVISGSERDDIPTQERGWKLFLLSRMVLGSFPDGGRRSLQMHE